MSFGLSRGRTLDPGAVGVTRAALPSLPDGLLDHPERGWIPVGRWFTHPDRPLELEIGSGKGTFLLNQAAAEPGVNFLGIEYAREFWLYACDRIRRAGLENVRLLNADATEFVRWRLGPEAVRTIHLYFPDPWPKRRHHRRRMIQHAFLADAARILCVGGELRVVTDHAPYWAWMTAHFEAWTKPATVGDQPVFTLEPFKSPPTAREGELVGTNFERKYREHPGAGGGGTEFFAVVLRKHFNPSPAHLRAMASLTPPEPPATPEGHSG
jgi:tRNA (guanine-N7-)-methyltransferase